MNYISTLITSINTELNHYVFNGFHAVMSSISLTLTLLLVIYFAGLGWLVIRGLIPITPLAIGWHMLKVAIICALAMHWDYFSFFIVNFIIHGPDKLLGTLLQSLDSNLSTSTITQGIAHLWQTGVNAFTNVWRESGPNFLIGNIMGLIGYGTVVGITVGFLFYVIMAKIILSILLVLAPVILPLYLWEATQSILHSWVKILVKWSFAPIFAYLFAAIFLTPLQTQIDILGKPESTATTAEISMFVLAGLLAILAFKQAGSIASNLAKNISWKDKNLKPWLEIPNAFINSWRQ